MTTTNPFKAALARGEPQIGLWLSLAQPYTAELCASAGFQWLLIDGEHAPNDVRSTLAQLQAVAPYPGHPVVRLVQGETALVKQVLDIGAATLLVPMVDSAEQAAALVAATRYPPEGVRGVGSAVARASRWGARAGYVDFANDEVCLLVQAESRRALDDLEAICAVDGVDGVFIGPADLAASMGHRGRPDHPEVQAAIDGAIRRIRACGKAAGTLTGDVAAARRYLELGASFVAVGIDTTLLAQATRRLAAEFALVPPVVTGPGPY
ncbi:4-hydroxy-2-oxoheptanedioate aldolase [Rubrivivax gelatinosus]|uniref:2,4-dihydroxyhept-2-enedioate aldolase n=1 Tax=Rubrivivax gelatinosus TaxID=28068 RepID=A0A4R2MIE7_RUBGE|nr:4-hydroxy-2-oxoheptanedioate aldolase [Rubrivivax gelatinosus]MBK1686327.1 2,4-dihydroxyhept-2-ene-1,7-dioic acid aldolase [Rubrivivax gelatinosus]TCP04454.1 2,4-dihydroxyhept-2-enedioate aldolase [Rubrivivax gelatinosus]